MHKIHERRRAKDEEILASPRDKMKSKAYDWLYLLYPEYTDNSKRISEPFPTGTYKVYQSVDNDEKRFRDREDAVAYFESGRGCQFLEWHFDVTGDDRTQDPPIKWHITEVYKPRLFQIHRGLSRWGDEGVYDTARRALSPYRGGSLPTSSPSPPPSSPPSRWSGAKTRSKAVVRFQEHIYGSVLIRIDPY